MIVGPRPGQGFKDVVGRIHERIGEPPCRSKCQHHGCGPGKHRPQTAAGQIALAPSGRGDHRPRLPALRRGNGLEGLGKAGGDPDQFEGLPPLGVVGPPRSIRPVGDNPASQRCLILEGRHNVVPPDTVGSAHPGDVVQVEVGDRSGDGCAILVNDRMVDQGHIKPITQEARPWSAATWSARPVPPR